MDECSTVETEDLRELAAEIRGLRGALTQYAGKTYGRERRILELLMALTQHLLPEAAALPPERVVVMGAGFPYRGSLELIEVEAVRDALETNRGNKYAAARQLGINVKTLYRIMRTGGLPLTYGQAGRIQRSILGNDPSPSARA